MVRHALLLPFLITLFILDRVFLVFAFWLSSEKFQTWLYKDELILESIHRVLIFLSSLSVIQLFSSLW
jgi:hypothetical protein